MPSHYKLYVTDKNATKPRSTYYRHKAKWNRLKGLSAKQKQEQQNVDNQREDAPSTRISSLEPPESVQRLSISASGTNNQVLEGTSENDQVDVAENTGPENIEPANIDHSLSADRHRDKTSHDTDTAASLRALSEPFRVSHIREDQFRDTLCGCTDVTSNDITLMIIAIGMRHKLTWEAQLDILKLISTIYPARKDIPLTKYMLFNRTDSGKVKVNYHIYCKDCKVYLGDRNEMNVQMQCDFCKKKLDVNMATNYFCSFSIMDQCKDLFEGPDEMGSVMLHHRANRQKLDQNSLEDVYDGSEYKRHCEPGGILSYPQNFSYNFFTDGVPVGKSGKSIWPIYITINELPEKLRSKYIILAGLYIGPNDPNINEFMRPFVREANILSSQGFEWQHDGVKVVSKAIPLCGVVDSVARHMMLNMQSFHAYFGCTFCYKKQEKTSSNKTIRYVVNLGEKLQERTVESLKEDVQEAAARLHLPEEKNRQYKGVKGASCLSELNYFNPCRGVVVDYMHCILIGVCKSHMILLFSSKFKPYWNCDDPNKISPEDLMNAVDKRLLQIKPPKSITRTPQPIKKLKMWKASEWRSWIIFYCILCLTGLLKQKYVNHIALLSSAMNILLQKSMTVADVSRAHDLLISYQMLYQEYFGKKHMVYNIHLLSHVCKGVLRYGPIWGHNAFPYEGTNRYILQMCTSPFNVVKQVSRRYMVNRSFPNLCVKFSCTDRVIDFCEDTLERHLKYYVYNAECVLVGKGTEVVLTDEEFKCLKDFSDQNDAPKMDGKRTLTSFRNMVIRGFRVSSTVAGKCTRNINNYVNITGLGTCSVMNIIFDCSTNKVLLLVKPLKVNNRPLLKEIMGDVSRCQSDVVHIRKVEGSEGLLCVSPKDITSQCVFMKIAVGSEIDEYVCELPYGCYRD